MIRFLFLFVIAMLLSIVSAGNAKAHGGGNGARVTVFSNGAVVVSGGGHHGFGPRVSVNGFGGPRFNPPSRFNQNGGVNRFGFRR